MDEIYKGLSSQKRQTSEDSLLDPKAAENTELNLKIKVIKSIFDAKQEEKNKALLAAERKEKKEKKEKIMEIIARKQDSALEKKSAASLQKMLDEL